MIRRLLFALALFPLLEKGFLLQAFATAQGSEIPEAIAAITDRVASIPSSDLEGGITVFGESAWPLIVRDDITVLAAAQAGEGRILAFTQGGLMGYRSTEDEGTERLFKQGIRWLAQKKRKPRLGVVDYGAVPLDNSLGFITDSWLDCDVMVGSAQCLRPEHLEIVRRRLREGAGLLLVMPDWSVGVAAPEKHVGNDSTVNRLMSPWGLTFDGRKGKETADGRISVSAATELSAMLHADRAWSAARANSDLSVRDKRVALSTLEGAAGFLLEDETELMIPMRRALLSEDQGNRAGLEEAMSTRLIEILEERSMQALDLRWESWRIAGPFDVGKLGRGERLFGKTPKIEASFAECTAESEGPSLEEEWKSVAGKRPWSVLETRIWPGQFDQGELDLAELTRFAMGRKAARRWDRTGALYLYRQLLLEEGASLQFTFEGSKGLRLWLDGELLGSAYDEAGAARLEAEVELEQGRHHLFVQTVQDGGSWLMKARVTRAASADSAEESPATTQEAAVNSAIDRGVSWLLEKQHIDGSFPEWSPYRPGFTALALYALGSSGLGMDHSAIRRGLAYLDIHPAEQTYSIASVLLARAELQRSQPELLQQKLEEGVKRLVDSQLKGGLWSYSSDDRLSGDLSNALFAALALDAARERGVEVPTRVWRNLIRGTTQCLERNSYGESRFLYAKVGDYTADEISRISFGSTTAAGLTILLLAGRGLGEDSGALEKAGYAKAVARSRAWIEGHMMWSRDPDLVGVTLMPCHPQYWWIY
ncbi:MAG: hypothetical protein AAF368_01100, partial [Planctomycetota bacterium]